MTSTERLTSRIRPRHGYRKEKKYICRTVIPPPMPAPNNQLGASFVVQDPRKIARGHRPFLGRRAILFNYCAAMWDNLSSISAASDDDEDEEEDDALVLPIILITAIPLLIAWSQLVIVPFVTLIATKVICVGVEWHNWINWDIVNLGALFVSVLDYGPCCGERDELRFNLFVYWYGRITLLALAAMWGLTQCQYYAAQYDLLDPVVELTTPVQATAELSTSYCILATFVVLAGDRRVLNALARKCHAPLVYQAIQWATVVLTSNVCVIAIRFSVTTYKYAMSITRAHTHT